MSEQVFHPEVETQPIQPETEQKVGFWEFFGLIALFAVPLVGFISAIVFMFAPKRHSMKNFARAVFAWMVVRMVALLTGAVLLFSIFNSVLLPILNDAVGSEFDNISDIFSIATDAMNNDYAAIIERLRPQLLDAMGEEYAPLLDELSKSEYNEMFERLMNSEYALLLEDIQNGQYSGLKTVISAQEYADFIAELEKAADVGYSEVFDELKNMIPSF